MGGWEDGTVGIRGVCESVEQGRFGLRGEYGGWGVGGWVVDNAFSTSFLYVWSFVSDSPTHRPTHPPTYPLTQNRWCLAKEEEDWKMHGWKARNR